MLDPSAQDMPFDRDLRRIRRDRAARAAEPSWLQRRLADDLIERLTMVSRDFTDVLDLGCGSARPGAALAASGAHVVSADAGRVFAHRAAGVQADEDRLPFADSSFDLVVSAGALDSVNDLPGALALIRRALRPDGLFLANFFGAGSLKRLRGAMMAAEEAEGLPAAPRIHPQIDVRAAGDLLARAGFALPVADAEPLNVRYPSLGALVGDLRALGGTNILRGRSARPFGRSGYGAAAADFQAHADPDGRTTERFEIIHLSGWAPSPDQPRPARRGSGRVSLASALKPPSG